MKATGWFRLWIVLCVLYAIYLANDTFDSVRRDGVPLRLTELAVVVLVWLAACLAVLGIGMVIRWVVRGFRGS